MPEPPLERQKDPTEGSACDVDTAGPNARHPSAEPRSAAGLNSTTQMGRLSGDLGMSHSARSLEPQQLGKSQGEGQVRELIAVQESACPCCAHCFACPADAW